MRALVTGSSGYLASLVLPRLAADPDVEQLLGLDVRPPGRPPSGFRHVEGSVLDTALAELFRKERVDMVVHLAWMFNPTHDVAKMREVDVGGTLNVFAAATEARVSHVVYLSSTTAYGAHADNPRLLGESAPARGTAAFPYSADKAAVEAALARFLPGHPELGVTVLRPSIVLGSRTDNFVRAILDLPVLIRIAGHDPDLQFLHEDDLADCLALMVKKRPRGTYNLAPARTVKMSELGPLVRRPMVALPESLARALVGVLWNLHLFGAPPSYLDFIQWPWVADGSRLLSELGFAPRRSSRDAVLATRRQT